MAVEWVERELATLDLGDDRRKRRAKKILSDLSEVADSTPHACGDEAALAATYRFADNPQADPGAILAAHREATLERIARQPVVVLAQDTTELDLSKPSRQVRGAGPLGEGGRRGFFFHPLYAMDEWGVPLGILEQVSWAREASAPQLTRPQKQRQRRLTPIEHKESGRWLEMFQCGEQVAAARPQTHFIHLADSEADIHELYCEGPIQAGNHDFIIRGCQARSVVAAESDGAATLEQALAAAPIRYCEEIDLSPRQALIGGEDRPRRATRAARVARVSVRATSVRVQGPDRPGGRLPDVQLQVVEAVELETPPGEEPIRWVLFTSLPVREEMQVRRVLRLYTLRWQVELFFKTLKSGLRIEKLKYQTLERYLRIAALLYIAAWRIEQVKMAARVNPQTSCAEYFEQAEWKAACVVSGRRSSTPPSIGEFILILAKLGGYLNKKGQGPPGSQTLWRGLQKLAAYRELYLALAPPGDV